MAKTLCTTCNKCPPGKSGCGIHVCLDVARREGASVAVGYEKGETTIVVMCSEYKDADKKGRKIHPVFTGIDNQGE